MRAAVIVLLVASAAGSVEAQSAAWSFSLGERWLVRTPAGAAIEQATLHHWLLARRVGIRDCSVDPLELEGSLTLLANGSSRGFVVTHASREGDDATCIAAVFSAGRFRGELDGDSVTIDLVISIRPPEPPPAAIVLGVHVLEILGGGRSLSTEPCGLVDATPVARVRAEVVEVLVASCATRRRGSPSSPAGTYVVRGSSDATSYCEAPGRRVRRPPASPTSPDPAASGRSTKTSIQMRSPTRRLGDQRAVPLSW